MLFKALDIPEHLITALKHSRRGCVGETNVDEKLIDQSRDGFIPDDPALGCYISCILNQFGMIDDDESIIWDKVLHLLPPSNLETATYVTRECKTICKLTPFLH